METFIKLIYYLFIFCVVYVLQVLCATGPNTSYNSTNAWTQLNSQHTYYANPAWSNFGQSGPTTPWPELGQPRGHRHQNQNNHRNNLWSQNINNSTWMQNGQIWNRPNSQYNINVPNNPALSSGTMLVNRGSNSGDNTGMQRQPSRNVTVQDDELREFSETLLQRDVNNAASYVTVNFQGKTTSRSQKDEAPLPLLTIHSDAYNIPTIANLKQLYNNYILETNANENVTPQEANEEYDLLDSLLSTTVMQLTKDFLINKGVIGSDPQEFRDVLKRIWFDMYARGGKKVGSSGFEHVFLAELKNTVVSGLHNWLYFKEEENKNTANYLGYLKIVDLGNKGAILKHHFKFHNFDKPVGSMFIGTSPELEIALYSTCFLLKADRVCPLRLAGHNFIIRTFTYRYKGKNLIGSAFPEI